MPFYYGPGLIFVYGDDEVYVHRVRVPADPTNAADLTRAEMQGRADAWAMFQAWKRDVPGFEQAYFIEAYPWIGVRESRRLRGQYVLTEEDLMKGSRFNDALPLAVGISIYTRTKPLSVAPMISSQPRFSQRPMTFLIARCWRRTLRISLLPVAAIRRPAAHALPPA